eukprot:1374823-Prorocentrum_lima.AAC.1
MAYRDDGTDSGVAPALVIERDASIIAVGAQNNPITFTSAVSAGNLPQQGLWGGLIINGNAPVFGSDSAPFQDLLVEGLEGTNSFYGGNDPNDNSGTLSYVRVWYGGSVIGADNEINGITFAGVGSGTQVDHIEVAFNLDDGVEFFGGTVDVKYVSVLFVGDDAIDTDQGYQGRIQYAFVMLGQGSNHGAEMDGPNTSGSNIAKRSFPQLYNALFVGDLDNDPNSVSSDDQLPAVLRLREGTGGEFGNLVVVNIGSQGIFQDRCQDESRATGSSPPATGSPDYLWISENTLFSGTSGVNVFETGTCGQ